MNLAPNDRAMIVGMAGWDRHLWIRPVTVSKVYKNGIIVLFETDQKYRPDGWPTGKRQGFSRPAKLEPWSDAKWQDFQRGESNRAQSAKLYKLGELFQEISTDSDAGADLWASLPFQIQQMLEEG